MPLSGTVPKPELHSGTTTETIAEGRHLQPEMSETNNSAVLAYPVQVNSQSFLQLALYPITLKVTHIFPFSFLLSMLYIIDM